MDYIIHLLIIIAFYTLLSQSLNLCAGFTGLISLAHAGFYGIGAYITAILSIHFGMSFWINLPAAMLICGIIALLISLIALRTVEDYFIICTLGIQVIIFSTMNNWVGLTKGPLGISGIPPVRFCGLILDSKISFLLLPVFFMLVVWWLLKNISSSGFGKTLMAISDDEVYAQSIGKNVYFSKTLAFTISAMIAAIPGVLYAHYTSYIDPTSFTLNESILILSIVIIGGMGQLANSFWAAVFTVLFPEILRSVGLADTIAANMREIIYGLVLVIIMATGKNGLAEFFIKKPKQAC